MKYYKNKTAKFFNGTGFYIVMAVCMIAVGFAAYSAMDAARMNNNSNDTSYYEEPENTENQDDNVILEPVNPTKEEPLITENEQPATEDVGNEAKEPYFVPPLNDAQIYKEYSEDTLQYSQTYNDMRLHTGIDLLSSENLLVLSCSSGTVASIDDGTIMGCVITIDHGNNIFIRYCGVKNVKVEVGSSVEAGTAIAEIGTVNNECADEAHLHLEVLNNGTPVDPTTIIPLK